MTGRRKRWSPELKVNRMAAIEIKEISKSFRRKKAVDGVSFTVDLGTITGFLGPNGAGKSTTLRCLLGLVSPDSGQGLVNGRAYTDLPNPLTEVGAVLEANNLHPGRRGRDHLRIVFPHAAQVSRVHRWVKESTTGRVRRTYAYVITSLPAEPAGAARLTRLVQGHRRIEALHHIRDVRFGEDASRVRSGHGPQNMAMLRNLVVQLLAELGHASIPEAVRWVSYEAFTRPLDLLGLA